MTRWYTVFVVMFILSLTACDRTREDRAEKREKAKPIKHDASPNVAGRWSGTWESIANKGHGGTVSCDAVKKFDNEWDAVILAEYGPETKFNIDLKGVTEKGKVVFGGTLNLGEEQGIYTWSGTATASVFSGEYKGPGENGVFTMTRVTSVSSAKPGKSNVKQ